MAAPKGNKNAAGNIGGGARSMQDRKLAAQVRSLALSQIMRVLEGKLHKDDDEFRKQLLLKLAATVLPRLNEVTGEDGAPVSVNVISYASHPPAQLRAPSVPAPATAGD